MPTPTAPSRRVIDPEAIPWGEHPRFAGIRMKTLLTSETHPLASSALVRVPPGGVIGSHHHRQETEIVYVLAGRSLLTLGETETPFDAGQMVAIPAGLEHSLRNAGQETVLLLTVFNPPLA
jgi:mannose-6-phosphate isomerase-like protein (cupin superfamily)